MLLFSDSSTVVQYVFGVYVFQKLYLLYII